MRRLIGLAWAMAIAGVAYAASAGDAAAPQLLIYADELGAQPLGEPLTLAVTLVNESKEPIRW